ncbi:MAG: alpha/beta fold hydrolase [Treponema sp.]|nr:alpha/beta fold hydrolase [Treponema sp.]
MFKRIYFIFFIFIVFLAAGIAGCASSENAGSSRSSSSAISPSVFTRDIQGLGSGSFTSENISIGRGSKYELDGILTIPEGEMPRGGFPAAVIVHGSGPIDMDGNVFAYSIYKDIAEYLSSSGIAVARYNKRTFSHPYEMIEELGGSLTVYEETIEDAVLAANLLRADPRVNSGRVFIIGHSLGGMLAPRIQTSGGNFAGLILMAGSPRFLLDISYDQNVDYIEKTMTGEEKANAFASLSGWDDMVSTILAIPDEDAKNVDIGGMSAYYLKDLYFHPVSGYIDNVRVPILVLQGSADFQVLADKDYALYKEMFTGRNNVFFNLYNGLNHMFIESTTGYTDEYLSPGNVDKQVLEDIARWIRQASL